MDISDLVKKYCYQRDKIKKTGSTYNETQLRSDYLNILFERLGWDIRNKKELPERLRDVTLEFSIKKKCVATKRPDYLFQVQGKRVFFLEAKKPSVNISENKKIAFQVRSYGWTSKLDFSVLCNFEKLIIYDCRAMPNPDDKPNKGVYKSFDHTEFEEKWTELNNLLGYESIISNKSPLLSLENKQAGELGFDKFFLKMLEKWIFILAGDLIEKNPSIDSVFLNHFIQILFNRILFLRICEEHEYEKFEHLKTVTNYSDLKSLFLEADKKYNSGIFKIIENASESDIHIESKKIIEFFSELYYPESPYSFSVISSEILGNIYEEYIGKRLINSNGKLELVVKPETQESGGVVSTPHWLAYKMVRESLSPILEPLEIEDVLTKRVADICVGSGIFLSVTIDVFSEIVVDKITKSNTPDKYKFFICKARRDELKPSLYLKHHIVTSCLLGVDIDSQAVEACKFGLLLKILEGETPESLGIFFEKHQMEALPDLDNIIVSGNALVTHHDYLHFKNNNKVDALYSVNPFNLDEFISSNNGVDLIVGNPPYIRIQKMIKYAKPEVAFYQAKQARYKTSKGTFDKYFLFIERAIGLLNNGGYLSYLIPNKFLSSKSGEILRKFILSSTSVKSITNFGSLLLFEKTEVYNCIIQLKKDTGTSLTTYKAVANLESWIIDNIENVMVEKPSLINSSWIFPPPQISLIFNTLLNHNNCVSLETLANIFVGVQTSNDSMYIIRKIEEDANFIYFDTKNGDREKIEKDILRPCLHDQKFTKLEAPSANSFIIFPYAINKGKAKVFDEDFFEERYPYCWAYLNKYKHTLSSRNIQPQKNAKWYQFGRTQSLTKFDGQKKIIWPVLSLRPSYSIDLKNTLFTGGGNGPYYGLKNKIETSESLEYIAACLRFPPIDAIVMNHSSKFKGGYGSHGKQYVKTLPVRKINFDSDEKDIHDAITNSMLEILKYENQPTSSNVSQHHNLITKQIETIYNQINTMLCNLYNISQKDYQEIVRFFY